MLASIVFDFSITFFLTFVPDPALGTSCAPSVLILFINMVLMKKSEDKPPCSAFMYSGQEAVQRTFLALGFLCIPVMLFGKPVYYMLAAKKRKVY